MQELNQESNSIKLVYDPDTKRFHPIEYIITKSMLKAKKRYLEWKAIQDKDRRGELIFV